MDTKTRPLHMLSTGDPPQNRGHIQTESEELEKDRAASQNSASHFPSLSVVCAPRSSGVSLTLRPVVMLLSSRRTNHSSSGLTPLCSADHASSKKLSPACLPPYLMASSVFPQGPRLTLVPHRVLCCLVRCP